MGFLYLLDQDVGRQDDTTWGPFGLSEKSGLPLPRRLDFASACKLTPATHATTSKVTATMLQATGSCRSKPASNKPKSEPHSLAVAPAGSRMILPRAWPLRLKSSASRQSSRAKVRAIGHREPPLGSELREVLEHVVAQFALEAVAHSEIFGDRTMVANRDYALPITAGDLQEVRQHSADWAGVEDQVRRAARSSRAPDPPSHPHRA